jgi:hypothetical protein
MQNLHMWMESDDAGEGWQDGDKFVHVFKLLLSLDLKSDLFS